MRRDYGMPSTSGPWSLSLLARHLFELAQSFGVRRGGFGKQLARMLSAALRIPRESTALPESFRDGLGSRAIIHCRLDIVALSLKSTEDI